MWFWPVFGLKSMTVGIDNVDVTTDDDSGFRTQLAEAGQVNLDISFDGIETDGVVRDLVLVGGTSQQYTDLTLTWPNGDVLSGTFNLGGYEESGTYNDAVTFSSSLQSSGEWTYTLKHKPLTRKIPQRNKLCIKT